MSATGREDAVTVRAVTREVGVAPQSFYLHFENLDSLLWEVYTREFSRLSEALAEAAGTPLPPRGRLDAVCRAYCKFALDHPASYRLMFSAGQPAHAWAGELPGTTAFVILRDAVAACTPSIDEAGAAEMASLLWAGLHGLVALRNDRPAFPWAPLGDLVEKLVTALLSARPDGGQ